MEFANSWALFVFIVVVAALIDILLLPGAAWSGSDETPRWRWIAGLAFSVFFCGLFGIYWWFSATRRAVVAEKKRLGTQPPKMVGPEATEEQITFLAALLRSKGLPDAEANGVAFVIGKRHDTHAVFRITSDLDRCADASQCRTYTRPLTR